MQDFRDHYWMVCTGSPRRKRIYYAAFNVFISDVVTGMVSQCHLLCVV
jgi:hypothetical protein